MQNIIDIAAKLDLSPDLIVTYGREMAKISNAALDRPRAEDGKAKLVLVSAMTPTPAGEGKTTTTIGLGDALSHLGQKVCLALREPSLGPCMGIKGGGTGGGRSKLVPFERINLHFTGDFHAVGSAHNLLAAIIDNHLHFGSDLDIDSRRVLWPRVMDMNDRMLRNVVLGLGGKPHGMPREAVFDITAASELMAMLCLCTDMDDLRARIDRTLIGFTRKNDPVVAGQLGITGSMLALMADTLMPNLVQTLDGTPALVHGGPFANIAHGCNSVLATKAALHLADWVVTEAGFGFDLGAEKFFDIKCRGAGLDPDAVVLVATVRALKLHGGRKVNELSANDPDAVKRGLPNLAKHIENVCHFKDKPVVAINRFGDDSDEELAVIQEFCGEKGVEVALCEHFARGGEGAVDLARKVMAHVEKPSEKVRFLYELTDSVPDKIRAVATKIYGADDVAFTKMATRDLANIDRLGYTDLPVCIAKTPSSLSDDPRLKGRPRDFETTVRKIHINSGAGFLVVLTGDVLRMPGLPQKPRANLIDVDKDGNITGLV